MSALARGAAACAWLVALSALAADAAAPRTVTLEDIEAIKTPDEPRLSRDGRQVAFVVEDQIFVVPAAGGPSRPLTSSSAKSWSPYWSRDGRTLYFLSDRSGTGQVWKLALDAFGEAVPVTTFETGIESLQFSPDESWLLLRSTEQGLRKPAEEKDDDDKAPEPFVITRLEFKEDAGEGYLSGDRAEHLFALDPAAGKLTQLTSGSFSEDDPAWSPDGKRIVFTSNREQEPDASYKSDLWVVDAANADRGASLVRLTHDDRTKSKPAWSPDGRTIAFLSAEDGVYGSPQVVVIPAAGGEARILTAGHDRWVNSFRWSSDGAWIYFVYEHEGGTRLARVSPKNGRIEPLIEGEYDISAFDIADSGDVALRLRNRNDGPELYAWARGRLQRLTDLNGAFLKSVAVAGKESVSFRSADGTVIQAFVTLPPGYDPARRYPTILDIHGGPVSQFSWGYDFDAQYYTAHGYVVVQPNPRGSTGRGQDFVRGIYQSWGISDYDDLIAAVDHVIARGWADPARLAVTGYSYGGYMTNVVITRTDRFKAAASGAGHSLIHANYGHDIYQKWYNWELGPPWENRRHYDRLSPLLQAGRVATPTLFLGGRDDWNVPILNAELF